MFFSQLSEYFQKIESTSSRNEMTAILADLLGKTSADEIDKVCYLLLGRLGPSFQAIEFGLAEKTMIKIIAVTTGKSSEEIKKSFGELGDLGEVIYKLKTKSQNSKPSSLEISEVYDRLVDIAETGGTGSQEKKIKLMADLLGEVDPIAAKYLVRIPLGTMRLGLADKTIIDSLSFMRTGSKKEKDPIERAYFVVSDIGWLAKVYKEKGLAGLKGLKPKIGVPIMPQLCERVPTAKEIIQKMGKAAVQPKYDGTRVQLHFNQKQKQQKELTQADLGLNLANVKTKGFVKAFTRNLEDVTPMFPELTRKVWREVRAKEAILDGEVVGFNPATGEFLPFQETVQRKRKYGISEKALEVPVKYFVFDILYFDGVSTMDWPYNKRRQLLEKIMEKKVEQSKGEERTFYLSPEIVTDNDLQLIEYFEEEVSLGLEGVVVKRIDSAYEAGARGNSWVKFKREEKGSLDDTIDCVVLGYYFGEGKRSGFGIGAFLVGVYDEKEDLFKTIAKIGTGLSDEEWRSLRESCDRLKKSEKPARVVISKGLIPDVWVEPSIVVIIRADEITKSPVHTAGKIGNEPGFALRFPRIMGFRKDKSATDATTVNEIKKLYEDQGQPLTKKTTAQPANSTKNDPQMKPEKSPIT